MQTLLELVITNMQEDFKKGIAGALIGAGILAGSGYNPDDVDPVTELTYAEIQANPEQDVYYIISISEINNDERYLEHAHQHQDTLRTSLDGTKAVVKYDVESVVRTVDLGEPYTNAEVIEYLRDPENGFTSTEEIVKGEDDKKFADPNL